MWCVIDTCRSGPERSGPATKQWCEGFKDFIKKSLQDCAPAAGTKRAILDKHIIKLKLINQEAFKTLQNAGMICILFPWQTQQRCSGKLLVQWRSRGPRWSTMAVLFDCCGWHLLDTCGDVSTFRLVDAVSELHLLPDMMVPMLGGVAGRSCPSLGGCFWVRCILHWLPINYSHQSGKASARKPPMFQLFLFANFFYGN